MIMYHCIMVIDIHYIIICSRNELGEIQDQIDYSRQVEERLKGELKELNGNVHLNNYSSLLS